MRAFQIYTGLGAGNIGDEFMARAFWERFPPDVSLEVPLAPEACGQRDSYPPPHHYVATDTTATDLPGLLVGSTPVTSAEGVEWPLRFLSPRLLEFHRRKQFVDAVGVGVDRLDDDQARRIFKEAFEPIRSWTVRSTNCVEALRGLGVAESRIRLGADWAWLYRKRHNLNHWAAAVWQRSGVEPGRPLLVANVVNMLWRDRTESRRALASALASIAQQFDMQIAFFCNESRPGEFFDWEAAKEIGGLTGRSHALVPREYYSPDEALALLEYATITVGCRYHFIIQSVLAGSVPVGILRGQKMRSLAVDLPFPVGGTIEEIDRDQLLAAIQHGIADRGALLARLTTRRRALARRAINNLSFLKELSPYCLLRWPPTD